MSESPVFELRTDPVMGRKVYISEGRAGRPTDFAGFTEKLERQATSDTAAHCPFCEGHESETPPESAELLDKLEQHWLVRVIPNKYPAVYCDEKPAGNGGPFVNGTVTSPDGGHEVIIESPDHLLEITDITLDQYEAVLGVYRERVRYWQETEGIQQVMLFKNVGFAAGASLEHLHSQVIAVPHVWTVMEAELAGATKYHQQHGNCVFCDLVAKELAEGTRVVAENERFLAVCAFAGRQPYETWILPKSHAADFHRLSDSDLPLLAILLQDLIARLRACLSPLTYNLVLHTAPVGGEYEQSYHWHWELIPRSTRLAGFEYGSGAHINPLSPERAASFLRIAEC